MPDPSVALVDFYSNQGTTFRRRLFYGYSALAPADITSIADIDGYYDLTDCTAEMFIRTWDKATIIARLSTEDTDPGIVLNAVQGAIDLWVSAADTDLWDQKKYRHDLELTYTDTGDVIKKWKGTIFNDDTMTRELDA